MHQQIRLKYWLLAIVAMGMITCLPSGVGERPVSAQLWLDRAIAAKPPEPSPSPLRRPTRPQDAGTLVYQKLSNFPLENQYVKRETGKVDPNNTLVNRLIRYHIYVKGRPAIYRLDWKLTLADYLGLNEPIEPASYPGADILKQNPFENDVAVIRKLDRSQRSALVQALVNVFDPTAQSPISAPTLNPASSNSQPAPSSQSAPSPGGARLLLP